jgi:metallo-beta-lactamase class B
MSMKMTVKPILGTVVACLAAAPLFAQKLEPMTAERIIGNLYYVGTTVHANYLVVTPQGDILINTGYEHTCH